jgi:predicted nucleotidyltransferase
MMNREQILDFLKQHRARLHEGFSVKRIGLFGSYVRNEATSGSDIDLLVEFDVPTFDHYMDLKFFLEDQFQNPVDLIMADCVKPRLRPYISQEVVYA